MLQQINRHAILYLGIQYLLINVLYTNLMKSTLITTTHAAERIIHEAGILFCKYFKHGTHIKYKKGDRRNIITTADIAIERFIIQRLKKYFPEHSILGEEFGVSVKKNSSNYQWLIDPIDGTTNFSQGIPYCAITIALLENSRPILGLIYNPITNDLYIARRKHGAYHNHRRLHVSNISDINQAFGAVHWGKNYILGSKLARRVILKTRKVRVNGCVALDLCQVAGGQYDFLISDGGHLNSWDIAAGILIVHESKGVAINKKGQPLRLNHVKIPNAICGNSELVNKLIQIIKKR